MRIELVSDQNKQEPVAVLSPEGGLIVKCKDGSAIIFEAIEGWLPYKSSHPFTYWTTVPGYKPIYPGNQVKITF